MGETTACGGRWRYSHNWKGGIPAVGRQHWNDFMDTRKVSKGFFFFFRTLLFCIQSCKDRITWEERSWLIKEQNFKYRYLKWKNPFLCVLSLIIHLKKIVFQWPICEIDTLWSRKWNIDQCSNKNCKEGKHTCYLIIQIPWRALSVRIPVKNKDWVRLCIQKKAVGEVILGADRFTWSLYNS